MKINNLMIKSSFFFACLVFLIVVCIGILNQVEVSALFMRAGVFFCCSGAVALIVFLIIGNSVEEEIIVMKEKEEEEAKRREEELKRLQEEREAKSDHYV